MSNVPVRRTTNAPRHATKDTENTNARPSRILTRSKALTATSQDASIARAMAPTIASKAKASGTTTDVTAGKRKREVLVEVTGAANNNGKKDVGLVKGKAKEETIGEGAKSKSRPASKPLRKSLRTMVVRPTASGTNRAASGSRTSTCAIDKTIGDVSNKERGKPTACPEQHPSGRAISSGVPPPLSVNDESERVFKKRHTGTLDMSSVQDDSQADADAVAAQLADIEEEPVGKAQLWDDLDKDDWDDPMMVSEYVAEICVYLKEVELATLPDPHYMGSQPEIDWEQRGILVDWVLQVHARFQMLQETLFLSVNILDRFLSTRPISLSKLQLVGITSFFIAAKFEETYAPSVSEIAYLTDGQASVDDVLKAESYILKTIKWDLRCPGPMGWLRRGSKADDCEIKARTVAKYLLEIGCLERQLVATLPSLLAAAALWLARLVLGREEWTANLEHYTTYSEVELLPTANIMLNYILEPVQHPSLFQKYAHKRHLKCSIFLKQWALVRWEEGTDVSLANALPEIKAEIRFERECEEM